MGDQRSDYTRLLRAEQEGFRDKSSISSTGTTASPGWALRVQAELAEVGIKMEIRPEHRYKGIRSYRVSGKKLERAIGFEPQISVEDSVKHMVQEIGAHGFTNFVNPRYYNVRWMQLLEEADKIISITGSVFATPAHAPLPTRVQVLRSGAQD